jgi:hypothetical protein
MNAVYQRYLRDEKFRNALHAAAHRQRSEVIFQLFSHSLDFFFRKQELRHAAGAHLARQG